MSASFSPTATSMLANATENNGIHVWDIDSGEMVRNIAGYSRIAIFSPDGRTIATASTGVSRDVLLMDVESGEMRFRMVGHTDAIRTASWSVDGKILATGSNDGTCKVWDSSTGALLRTIDLGDEDIKSAAWGRNWVLGAIAFAMGHHSRLGAGSRVLALEAGVAQMILDRV